MNMLENPLAVVELDFLEQLQVVKEWNDHLFEIFQWLGKVEDTLLRHNQLHVFLLNDDHIFYKKRIEKKIGIYPNFFTLKPEDSKQLIVVCSNKEISKQIKDSIAVFVDALLEFLEDKKIKNQILPESCVPQLSESLAIEKMIEVLIGIAQ